MIREKKECIKWTLITHLQKTFFTLSNIRCETKDCSGRILLFHPYHSKQNASLLDIKAHGNSQWFKFTECYKNRQMMHALTPWISRKLNSQDFREEYSFVLNTSHRTLIQDTLNFPQNPFIPTWSLSKKFAMFTIPTCHKPSLVTSK